MDAVLSRGPKKSQARSSRLLNANCHKVCNHASLGFHVHAVIQSLLECGNQHSVSRCLEPNWSNILAYCMFTIPDEMVEALILCYIKMAPSSRRSGLLNLSQSLFDKSVSPYHALGGGIRSPLRGILTLVLLSALLNSIVYPSYEAVFRMDPGHWPGSVQRRCISKNNHRGRHRYYLPCR